MKQTFNFLFFLFFAFSTPLVVVAQTEESAPLDGVVEPALDDVVDKTLMDERRILKYDNVREGDLFWQKRIWRVIDLSEKMNLPFTYPEEPFIQILLEAAKSGEATVYSTIDDKFTSPFSADDVKTMGSSVDTIITFNPDTYEEEIQIVTNDLNPEDIKRYRIKEDWFFDSESSTLQVRILGIAPLKEVYDDNDNFLYEQPLFWAYYPYMRDLLARKETFNPFNDAIRMSWEDIFEMRYFSSYISKESNVYDRRIKDYKSGLDILVEADNIKEEILNFEHDLWTY